jgi:hypothetical protein
VQLIPLWKAVMWDAVGYAITALNSTKEVVKMFGERSS